MKDTHHRRREKCPDALRVDLRIRDIRFRAQDGITAYPMAKRQGHDLIFFDIMLPEMNGFEVANNYSVGITTPMF